DARELGQPVIEDRERLAALDVGEEDEAAINAGLDAIFPLGASAVVFLLVDDVRLHADGEIAAGGAAFDAAPLIDLSGLLGRDHDVGARLAHSVGGDELTIGLIERVDGLAHGEQPGHIRIADDQHIPSTWRRKTPAYAV